MFPPEDEESRIAFVTATGNSSASFCSLCSKEYSNVVVLWGLNNGCSSRYTAVTSTDTSALARTSLLNTAVMIPRATVNREKHMDQAGEMI